MCVPTTHKFNLIYGAEKNYQRECSTTRIGEGKRRQILTLVMNEMFNKNNNKTKWG